jgi:hypothetical protein
MPTTAESNRIAQEDAMMRQIASQAAARNQRQQELAAMRGDRAASQDAAVRSAQIQADAMLRAAEIQAQSNVSREDAMGKRQVEGIVAGKQLSEAEKLAAARSDRAFKASKEGLFYDLMYGPDEQSLPMQSEAPVQQAAPAAPAQPVVKKPSTMRLDPKFNEQTQAMAGLAARIRAGDYDGIPRGHEGTPGALIRGPDGNLYQIAQAVNDNTTGRRYQRSVPSVMPVDPNDPESVPHAGTTKETLVADPATYQQDEWGMMVGTPGAVRTQRQAIAPTSASNLDAGGRAMTPDSVRSSLMPQPPAPGITGAGSAVLAPAAPVAPAVNPRDAARAERLKIAKSIGLLPRTPEDDLELAGKVASAEDQRAAAKKLRLGDYYGEEERAALEDMAGAMAPKVVGRGKTRSVDEIVDLPEYTEAVAELRKWAMKNRGVAFMGAEERGQAAAQNALGAIRRKAEEIAQATGVNKTQLAQQMVNEALANVDGVDGGWNKLGNAWLEAVSFGGAKTPREAFLESLRKEYPAPMPTGQ